MSQFFGHIWGSSSEGWRAQSACRSADPALFFPLPNTVSSSDQVYRAKQICNTCDVRDACLDFALKANQDAGVWGGTSEQERRRIRRRRLAERRRSG